MLQVPFSVIVINRARDTARMAHMRVELARLHLPFVRFDAVEGANVPPHLRDYFPAGASAFLTPGEIGCYASHLAICELIAHGQIAAPVLVLEDDVSLAPDLAVTLARAAGKAPRGWDMIRLSNRPKLATLRIAVLARARDLVWCSQQPVATGGYLISHSGAEKFLAAKVRLLPVDDDFRRVWAWGMQMYAVDSPPVRQNAFGGSVIDALAAGARLAGPRRAANRRRRRAEHVRRIAHVYATLGPLRASVIEMANLIARALPRRWRLKLFALVCSLVPPPGWRAQTEAPRPSRRGASRLTG